MWESSKPALGTLPYDQTAECPQTVEQKSQNPIHELRIEGLKPGTQYFTKKSPDAVFRGGVALLGRG